MSDGNGKSTGQEPQAQWRYIAYYAERNGSGKPREGALRGVVVASGGDIQAVCAVVMADVARQLGLPDEVALRGRVYFQRVTITRVDRKATLAHAG